MIIAADGGTGFPPMQCRLCWSEPDAWEPIEFQMPKPPALQVATTQEINKDDTHAVQSGLNGCGQHVATPAFEFAVSRTQIQQFC